MKRLILGLLAGLTLPAAASAQDVWGWSILVPSYAQTDILGTHLRDRRAQDEALPPSPPATPRLSQPANLRYAPSKARRTANLAGFVARSRAADSAGARSLEALFAEGDIIERMGQLLAPHGLRVDDVGDAYAVWWISAWQATRGLTDTPSDSILRAVRAQTGRALATAPELAGAGDGAKQQLAEAMLIQAALLDAAVVQAQGDPTKLRAVATAATQGARGMGLDLAGMELTGAGFAQRAR